MKIAPIQIVACLLSMTSFLVSCKDKKDEAEPQQSSTVTTNVVKNLAADTVSAAGKVTGRYTLFSFKNNTIVPNSDSASLKWDVGFNSTTIIVNGGSSGPGQAATQIWVGLYGDLAAAPESGYKQDDKTISPPNAIPTGSGNGWYNYNMTTHVISAIPGRVLVFRTAEGKYAKVEIISYYKDMPANPTDASPARYYTFRYAYQDNGSKTF